MTLPAELNAATREIWGDTEPNDIVFKASPALYFLYRNKKDPASFDASKFKNDIIDTSDLSHQGTELRFPIESALPGGGSMNNGTIVNHTQTQLYTYASATMGTAYSEGVVNHTEQVQNTGPGKVFDLAVRKVSSMKKKAQDILGNCLYQYYSGSGILYGIPDCCNATDTSTDYLGISEASLALWDGKMDSSTAPAMTFKTMQAIRAAAKVRDGAMGMPNLYLTSQALRDAYEAGLETQQRFEDEAAADAGWLNVKFGGVPIVADNKLDSATNGLLALANAKTGTGYGPSSVVGLNLDYWRFMTHPDFNMKFIDWAYELNRPQIIVSTLMWVGCLVTTHRGSNIWYANVTAP